MPTRSGFDVGGWLYLDNRQQFFVPQLRQLELKAKQLAAKILEIAVLSRQFPKADVALALWPFRLLRMFCE